MKIKTEKYGVFYKDGEKWRGPINGETFTEKEIISEKYKSLDEFADGYKNSLKKKTKVFRQVWKSV